MDPLAADGRFFYAGGTGRWPLFQPVVLQGLRVGDGRLKMLNHLPASSDFSLAAAVALVETGS